MRVGTIQPMEGLNKTKRQSKGDFALCLSCWDIYLLQPSDMSAPSSRAFGLGQGLTPLPACRWQILGLLCPHYHVHQFLQ